MAVQVSRLDRIAAEAKKLRFSRAILTILLVPLFLVGWLAAKGWQAVTFIYAAIKVGWHEGNV